MLRALTWPAFASSPANLIRVARPARLLHAAPRRAPEPLRILFCGADEFSIESLRVLHDERLRNPRLIESIDVLVRPPKRTGRGLSILREGECGPLSLLGEGGNLGSDSFLVPLELYADWLQLPIIRREKLVNFRVRTSLLTSISHAGEGLQESAPGTYQHRHRSIVRQTAPREYRSAAQVRWAKRPPLLAS